MDSNCEVSVLCTTYNQESYIRDAIDSILSQNIPFTHEIIIHDDASTDGTESIVQEYSKKYPLRIRLIQEKENQYSRGVDFITELAKKEVNGKYIALCEGDDFWIYNNKLKQQYEALESHSECDMCACWGCTVTEDGKREISQIRPRIGDGFLSTEEVILGGGQYLVTAGLMFRKNIYDKMFGLNSLDYSLQIRGSMRGGIYYIDKKMAAYRRYSKGSWTNSVLHNKDRLQKQWAMEKRLLRTFDYNTNGKYHKTIEERLKAYTTFDEQLEMNRDEMLSEIDCIEQPCFLWGLGRRGKSMEAFIKKEGLDVDGVCDATDVGVGEQDAYGFSVFSTDYVKENAKTILASTRWAYDDLIKLNLKSKVIDLQKYMPDG